MESFMKKLFTLLIIILFGVACGGTTEQPMPMDINIAGKIIITEIKGDKDEIDDYIEIYNTTDQTINIANFYVTDKTPMEEEGNKVILSNSEQVIEANEYLIICVKPEGSYEFRSGVTCLKTEGEIGIGGEESDGIRLKNAEGEVIDEVLAPLQEEDSLKLNDSSLELSANHLDHIQNDSEENWGQTTGITIHFTARDRGTPGARNKFTR